MPNRIDDMMGEVANVQLHSPEIVTGYVMIFNVAKDRFSPRHGATWCELLTGRLESLSGRRPPAWTTGTVEDFLLLRVDFDRSPTILSTSQPFEAFFDTLVEHVAARNPGALRRG